MRRFLASALLVSSLFGVGCASSPAMVRAAEGGDNKTLRTEIDARHKLGTLTNDEAATLAHAVADREIKTSKGDDAAKRVREVRGCAGELDDTLADRMKTHDEAGAEAAMARFDLGKLDGSDVRPYATDKNDVWRAVGVRGLTREIDHPARLRAMTDPSPRVRRAAMRASSSAHDASEVDALAEAVRIDPEPMVRSDAVRALGAIGGEKVAAILRDSWVNADDGIREDIAAAWVVPDTYAHGGRESLRVLIASKTGPGVIAGASAVARSAPKDRELHDSAVGLLVRSVASAPRRDRLHAIAVAPVVDADVLGAMRKAAHEDDIETKVSAFARLLESPADRAEAVQNLESISGQNYGALSGRARFALAIAGDLRIQAWIEADLLSADAQTRLSAVGSLAALGRSARGAMLLADPDPSVRASAACTLLSAPRTAH
ncbi:MAG: HEAT repeat domain-containing protein [Polyangiaceae bacterium]